MIVSDKSLKVLMDAGQLCISPMEEHQIQPASVDIRIGDSFCEMQTTQSGDPIEMNSKVEYNMIHTNRYVIGPGEFVLATTMEYFKLPDNLTAFVEGRSSIGRLGLFIQNAGWVDPGFEGEITLELFNASVNSIVLETGRRVGQMVFAQLDRDAENPYRGKYQGQRGAVGSRIDQDSDFSE